MRQKFFIKTKQSKSHFKQIIVKKYDNLAPWFPEKLNKQGIKFMLFNINKLNYIIIKIFI